MTEPTGSPNGRGLRLIEPETATAEVAFLLAAVQRAFGVTSNMAKAMANSPTVLKGYLDFSGALRDGALSAGQRERIALLVAQENQCDYCLSVHTYIGTKVAGLTEAQVTMARKGRADDSHTTAALAFAAALMRHHGNVTDAELVAARGGGLSDGQIAEIIANVALSIFTNYLNKAARVDIDWPLVRHTD